MGKRFTKSSHVTGIFSFGGQGRPLAKRVSVWTINQNGNHRENRMKLGTDNNENYGQHSGGFE